MNRNRRDVPASRWTLGMVGEEMADLVRQLRDLDGQGARADEELMIARRLESLECFAAALPARVPAEGLVQVLVLASVRDDVEAIAESAEQAEGLAPMLRRMDDCLTSLARLLAREGEVPPGALPIDWYLGCRAV